MLVIVTALNLAVFELFVDSQLKSNLNNVKPACKIISDKIWLLFVSLY